MQLKEWMVIILLASLTAFASILAVTELSSPYGITTNSSLISSYSAGLSSIHNDTQNIYNNVQSGDISTGGNYGAIFGSIGSFFKILLNIITLPITWTVATITALGIPVEVGVAIITLIIISVVFAVLSAMLRKTP